MQVDFANIQVAGAYPWVVGSVGPRHFRVDEIRLDQLVHPSPQSGESSQGCVVATEILPSYKSLRR